jgi:hypothetical protein
MTELFLLSVRQMTRISPFFPLAHGVPRVDDRRVVSGIVYVIKNGLQWKDAPKGYGPHKTLYNRFIRWSRLGGSSISPQVILPEKKSTGSYVDGPMASVFCSEKRFGYLRSYVRPLVADKMSAGPDEVRQTWIPIITARLMRLTQYGLFQAFGHNRVVHHFYALTNLNIMWPTDLFIWLHSSNERSSSHKYFPAKSFTCRHHSPDDPSEFIRNSNGH